MKTRSPDIYDVKNRGEGAGDFAGGARPGADAWVQELRRSRRASRFFGLTVLAFFVLLVVIVFQQYLISVKPHRPAVPTSRPAAAERLALRTTDSELTPDAVVVTDELTATEVLPIPQGGNMPLSAQWLKQAAYYVAMAEKAYRSERIELALEDYQKALLVFPNLKGIHRYIGLIYLQLKDYPSAAEHFKKASEEDAASFGVANNLGVAYLALKDYEAAEEYFLQALKLKPGYALAHLNLATLHLRAGHKEKAAEYFKDYLDIQPDDVRAAQAYASVLIDLERWQEAVQLLERVRLSAPEVAPVYFRLAQALSHSSNPDAAIQILRRGSTLIDPRKALAWLARPDYDLLRDKPDFQDLIATLSAPEP